MQGLFPKHPLLPYKFMLTCTQAVKLPTKAENCLRAVTYPYVNDA